MHADLLRPARINQPPPPPTGPPTTEYQDHLLDGFRPSVAQERESVVTPLVTQGDEDIELSNNTPSEETFCGMSSLSAAPSGQRSLARKSPSESHVMTFDVGKMQEGC